MRTSFFRWSLLALCILPLPVGTTIVYADSPVVQPADQSKWPKEVTVTVGDVRTRIDGPKMWTMSGLDYQDAVIATEESAYGAVVTIRGVGHLGTAHFLDVKGKPGQVEKEVIDSMKLFVDDKLVTDYQPTMAVSGKSFRMERVSKIRDIDVVSTITLADGVLVEKEHLHANKAVDLQMSYPLMYAWAPQNTHYLFGDDSGVQKRGEFRKEGKSDDGGREKASRWMAVFNAANGKGAVFYLVQTPKDATTFIQWTDAPGIYRKLRIMTFVETIMPEGFDGAYEGATTFFNATATDWEKQALAKVDQLKAVAAKLNK